MAFTIDLKEKVVLVTGVSSGIGLGVAREFARAGADDTGLEVESLGGAPGVYSARYANGQGHDSQANMNKLLKEMEEKNDRKAQFRTIISLIEKGEERQFEGIVKGQITREKRGESGFGYDPIFQPDGYETTFAELGSDIKNRISHRARAVAALCDYLRKNNY